MRLDFELLTDDLIILINDVDELVGILNHGIILLDTNEIKFMGEQEYSLGLCIDDIVGALLAECAGAVFLFTIF